MSLSRRDYEAVAHGLREARKGLRLSPKEHSSLVYYVGGALREERPGFDMAMFVSACNASPEPAHASP